MRNILFMLAALGFATPSIAQSRDALEVTLSSGSSSNGGLYGLSLFRDGKDGIATVTYPDRKMNGSVQTYQGPKLKRGRAYSIPSTAAKGWMTVRLNAADVRTLNVLGDHGGVRFVRHVIDRGSQASVREDIGSVPAPQSRHRLDRFHSQTSPDGSYTMILCKDVYHDKLVGLEVLVFDSAMSMVGDQYIAVPLPMTRFRFGFFKVTNQGLVGVALLGRWKDKEADRDRSKEPHLVVAYGIPGSMVVEEVALAGHLPICAALDVSEQGEVLMAGLAMRRDNGLPEIFTRTGPSGHRGAGAPVFSPIPEVQMEKLLFSANKFKQADRDEELDEEAQAKDDRREHYRLVNFMVTTNFDQLSNGDHVFIAEVQQNDQFCTGSGDHVHCTPIYFRGNLCHFRVGQDGTVTDIDAVSKLYRASITDVLTGVVALYDGDTIRILFNEFAIANRVGKEMNQATGTSQPSLSDLDETDVVTSCFTYVPGGPSDRVLVPELQKKGNWLSPQDQLRLDQGSVVTTFNTRSGSRFVRLELIDPVNERQ
ncbi:MAG: hypothetical protein H6597_01790 [Flavobacteriales bacterium]|nr:hypothetical protein [Flavobacteriales bacterium]MCB9193239.1 hypothetical protein [Flavobacteriales bacterium]